MMKKLLIKLIATTFFVNLSMLIYAQAKLVLNGGILNISNGAVLVIDNPDNSAITYNGSGYIQSEGGNNRVIWNIGPGNGNTYLIPFGNTSDFLPVKFNAVIGVGTSGSIVFSTYPTPTWKNSDFLSAGVTNVNHNGTDNSANVIDRFWQIKPVGYTTKPDFTNLTFTYSDNEYKVPNTITEANLIAQRWNASSLSWSDYIPASIINTADNTVTVPAIAGNNLYDWWTLVDKTVALPVTLISFKAYAANGIVQTTWQTSSEQNISHFEVWRGTNVQQLYYSGSVLAAGYSTTPKNYYFNDVHPLSRTSYYRLKIIDNDGVFKWSDIVPVYIDDNGLIILYPNPAEDYVIIKSNSEWISRKPTAHLYDAQGKLIQKFKIKISNQVVNISGLSAGSYNIYISSYDKTQILTFIKK